MAASERHPTEVHFRSRPGRTYARSQPGQNHEKTEIQNQTRKCIVDALTMTEVIFGTPL